MRPESTRIDPMTDSARMLAKASEALGGAEGLLREGAARMASAAESIAACACPTTVVDVLAGTPTSIRCPFCAGVIELQLPTDEVNE